MQQAQLQAQAQQQAQAQHEQQLGMTSTRSQHNLQSFDVGNGYESVNNVSNEYSTHHQPPQQPYNDMDYLQQQLQSLQYQQQQQNQINQQTQQLQQQQQQQIQQQQQLQQQQNQLNQQKQQQMLYNRTISPSRDENVQPQIPQFYQQLPMDSIDQQQQLLYESQNGQAFSQQGGTAPAKKSIKKKIVLEVLSVVYGENSQPVLIFFKKTFLKLSK